MDQQGQSADLRNGGIPFEYSRSHLFYEIIHIANGDHNTAVKTIPSLQSSYWNSQIGMFYYEKKGDFFFSYPKKYN